jgi:hypothetical protein
MQPAVGRSGSIVERALGVIQLRKPVFEEIEHDTNATGQALVIVVAAAIAAAIGGANEAQAGGPIWQALLSIVGWIAFSFVAFFVGTTLFKSPQTDVSLGQVMRLVGFAQAPKILAVFGFIPLLGGIIGLVAAVWFVVVAVYALAAAFDTDEARGGVIGLVSLVAWGLIALVVGLVLGAGVAFLRFLF